MKSKHRGPSKFRKTEATRLVRAALDAGLTIKRVEIDPATGRISVIPGSPGDAPNDGDELDKWMAERHAN